MAGQNGSLKEPLLRQENVTRYENANIWSRLSFTWLSPLLKEGATKTLDIDDVPNLAKQHRATFLYEKFSSNWPKERVPDSTSRTLGRTFWWPILVCGWIALVKLSVTYVGPLLIQSFVDYTSGIRRFPYEGYVLVLVLTCAKAVEVVSTHQYTFTCNKLGMEVRSAVIAAVYRKGLRLSSAARQSHGVGQIVNYMSVDVQQLSDACLQLHYMWSVPAQLVLAMVILWSVVGPASLAGLTVLVFTGVLNVFVARYQKTYQIHIMEGRDLRIKVFNEALNNMKVGAVCPSKLVGASCGLELGWSWDMYSWSRMMLASSLPQFPLSQFTEEGGGGGRGNFFLGHRYTICQPISHCDVS